MVKIKRARYTLEFKVDAVHLVTVWQSVAAVAATLWIPYQALLGWQPAVTMSEELRRTAEAFLA